MGLLEVLTFLIMKQQRMVTQRYARSKDNHCVGLEHTFHEHDLITCYSFHISIETTDLEQCLRRFSHVSCRRSED